MRTILETRRLILRELCPNDFHEVCKLLQDNEVMYAYEGAFNGTEVREWLDRQIKRYAEDKVGLWGAVLKENGELIGQCGITIQRTNRSRNRLSPSQKFLAQRVCYRSRTIMCRLCLPHFGYKTHLLHYPRQ